MRTRRLLYLCLITAVLLSACATVNGPVVKEQTKKAIIVAAETYDTVMLSLGVLYRAGKLTNADRDKAVEYANEFRGAALAIAENVDTPRFEEYIATMNGAIGKLRALLSGIGGGGGMAELDRMERSVRTLATAKGAV